ncbi:muconolactone Delta-isomerase family protein [Chloroflexota bacterium]
MKYLISMKVIESAYPRSPDQLVPFLEQVAIPFLEALKTLEAEKKILAGGGLVGKRASVFIIEAASNEELDQLLVRLPTWSIMEVDVTPLRSFKDRAKETRQGLERLKAAHQ